MNETVKTTLYVASAAVLGALAWMAAPTSEPPPVFDDQGTPFFPGFTDPVGTPDDPTVTAMEVISYDEATASAHPFKVEFKDGVWRIPSHHDYPADAYDHVAKTASGVVGLTRDKLVSTLAEDHARLGVLDPLAESVTDFSGLGRRITLRDRGGQALADFIIGKEVKDSQGMHYVRLPDSKRTYAVKVDLELSTNFSDWIETDLLELEDPDLREVVIDTHSVNEATGTVDLGEKLELTKDDEQKWQLAAVAEGETLQETAVKDLARELGNLKIVGVRRKPEGLTHDLRQEEGMRLDEMAVLQLQQKGYFVARSGQLYSNDGELRATTKDGVEYTLRFGEVLYGSGEALTAGTEGEGEGAEKSEGSTETRYLFVTAHFDEEFLPKPEMPEVLREDAAEKPDDGGETPATDPLEEGEEGEDGGAEMDPEAKAAHEKKVRDEAEKAWKASMDQYEEKVERGRKKAKELSDRFAEWYYVISAQSFKKLHLGRADLVKSAEPSEEPVDEDMVPPQEDDSDEFDEEVDEE